MGKTKRYPSGLCSKDFCFNLRLIVCIKKMLEGGNNFPPQHFDSSFNYNLPLTLSNQKQGIL
jgi:hypothetical protein